MSEAVTRNGELTMQSLADALDDERRRGREPHALYVGAEMHAAGLRIVGGFVGFPELCAVMPRVEVDASLAPHEWELRQEDEMEGHEAP